MSRYKYIDDLAIVLWDYLQLHEEPKESDVIFCLCSHDTRVAERASTLMLTGRSKYLVFSGGFGKLTDGLFENSEAETFAQIALEAGVAEGRIIIEDKSTNTGENIRFTYELLEKKKITFYSMILVQKPYMERRTLATFLKQWPRKDVKICVTSPQISFEEYMNAGIITKNDVINVMVGDMQRIREYPKLGFQVEQEIPNNVWSAFNELVNLGFDKHLISN